jgi:hypothetical protein
MDMSQLILLDQFDNFTLYYDRIDKSLWVFDGKHFKGTDAEEFYIWMIE